MEMLNENVIEWLKDEKTASITVTQGRFKSKLERLAEKYPQECEVLHRNDDGSIFAHVPLSWIKIGPPRKVELTDERKKELAARLKGYKNADGQE